MGNIYTFYVCCIFKAFVQLNKNIEVLVSQIAILKQRMKKDNGRVHTDQSFYLFAGDIKKIRHFITCKNLTMVNVIRSA